MSEIAIAIRRPEGVRPALPSSFYEPSAARGAAFVLFAVGLFAGAGILAALVAGSAAPAWLRAVALPVLVLAAAHGAHLVGFVGHEGIHLTLHPSKKASVLLGTFFSAMTPFSAVGFGVSHWAHHRFTNQASDPDARLYSRFRTVWSRLLFARAAANRLHFGNLAALVLGKPLAPGYKLPFSRREQRALALVNVACHAFWLTVYGALAAVRPEMVLVGIVVPLAVALPLSGLRGYVEHGGTGVGLFRDARSWTAPVYALLFLGNNFHLEHHLYPSVPCWRLPAVHRWLRARGHLMEWGRAVDDSALGPLAHVTRRTQYPAPFALDLRDEPAPVSRVALRGSVRRR